MARFNMQFDGIINLKGRGIFGGKVNINQLVSLLSDYAPDLKFDRESESSIYFEGDHVAAAEDLLELALNNVFADEVNNWMDQNGVQFSDVTFSQKN